MREAAALADAEGLAALTLARLAARFGVRAPSLYNHVSGLEALHRELALLGLRELGERLARGPATAYGLIKRGLYRSQASDLETMLEVEVLYQEIAGRAPDFPEGLAAFREKRPPRFAE